MNAENEQERFDLRERLTVLQLFHIGLQVDCLMNYRSAGMMDEILRQDAAKQILAAPGRVVQFDISTPEEVFKLRSELFGYADFHFSDMNMPLQVVASRCKLCAVAKMTAAGQPCSLFCIQPLRSLCGALEKPFSVDVMGTLWCDERCSFILQPY